MKPTEKQTTYKSILKGTALFGGTQMVNIVANVLRGKMVAVLLGTFGLGVSSLYMSSLMPLQQFFSMGLPLAAVSALAALSEETDGGRCQLAAKVEAYRRCLFVLAILGVFTVIISAPLLSTMAFGGSENSIHYMILAAALFFLIMESGEMALLQARRQMKQVALRNVVNALSGLLVGVPLYWWLGVKGIVPAIVMSALAVWVYTRWQTHGLQLCQPKQSWAESWKLSRGILSLGFFMMLAALFGTLTTYAVNTAIRYMGCVPDVGLYQAASSITGQYVGLVFAAMATDYYPRLASLVEDRTAVLQLVEREWRVVMLIITPLVALLVLTAPLLIRILLTEEFLPLTGVVKLMGLAIVCRAACFPLDYISMAYGRKKYFFWMEGVWCNAKTFVITVVFYYFWGLEGLGWATLLSGLVDVVVTTVCTHVFFGIRTYGLMLRYFVPSLVLLSVLVMVK